MNTQLLKEYRKFRGHGCIVGRDASYALHAARTVLLFTRPEWRGMVRLEILPDEDYNPRDFSDDEQSTEAYNRDGAWGVVGEYRLPVADGDGETESFLNGGYVFSVDYRAKWDHGDSVWGHVGYRNVDDPHENVYVVDIMAATIDALRTALKSRCPKCRRAAVA